MQEVSDVASLKGCHAVDISFIQRQPWEGNFVVSVTPTKDAFIKL